MRHKLLWECTVESLHKINGVHIVTKMKRPPFMGDRRNTGYRLSTVL